MRAIRLASLIAALAVTCAVEQLPGAIAQASTPSAIKIGVSPTRAEIKPLHGKPYTMIMRVYSDGSNAVRLTAHVEEFGEIGARGDFGLRAPQPGSGASWLTVSPTSFTLSAGQVRDVRATIHPPTNFPGQRYLAVVFVTAPPRPTHGASAGVVTAGVASEIILDSREAVRRDTSISLHAPGFSTGGPVPVTLTVADHGNVYSLLNHLRVTDGTRPVLAFPGMLVLAASHRTVTADWASHPLLCIPCTIRLGSASASVVILPIWQVLGGLAILTGLVLMVVFRRRAVGRKIDREVARRLQHT